MSMPGMAPRPTEVVAVCGAAHRTLEGPAARVHHDLPGTAVAHDLLGGESRTLAVERGLARGVGCRDLRVELGLQLGDGLLDLCLLRLEGPQPAVELIADRLLGLLLMLEIGLLFAQRRGHDGELLDDVVVGLVRVIEQLLATDGLRRASRADQRVERIAGVRVGEHRSLAATPRSSSARALVVAMVACNLAIVSLVCSS